VFVSRFGNRRVGRLGCMGQIKLRSERIQQVRNAVEQILV
jgi:hypothetical protein